MSASYVILNVYNIICQLHVGFVMFAFEFVLSHVLLGHPNSMCCSSSCNSVAGLSVNMFSVGIWGGVNERTTTLFTHAHRIYNMSDN